ncbi:MAG TPA: NAD-dependent epimerase/dehydratase family protein [Actinomycetota bacterium]
MRTLVTGGAGFIGSALVDRLVYEGHEVVVLDDLSSGNLENLADALASGHAEHVEVDLAGPELDAVVAEARPEVVFHLAAQIDVRRSVADPVADARTNVLGSVALAKAAGDNGVRRLVFAGSGGTAYGEPDPADLPVDEDYPPRPTSPYGVAKRSVEDYLVTFTELYGLETVSLRLGNVYGPRQDPHGEAGVVAIFCTRLLTGEPVVVYGDGTQTRDYVYVDDVVEAFLAAAAGPQVVGRRLNVGTGVETSVLELYATLREVTGFGPEPTFAPARAGEMQRIGLDVRRAKELLGWRALVDLRTGMERTWAWAFQQVNTGSVGG